MPNDSTAAPIVVVTFAPSSELRAEISSELGAVATIVVLPELAEAERAEALSSAKAVLSWNLRADVRPEESDLLASVGLLQLLSAGVDNFPFDLVPPNVPIASNAGAYSGPMAEHVLALALALAKRLPQNQEAMQRGEFNQQAPSREIRGSIVGILGYGGIGSASARLFTALGARIHAINSSGRTADSVDWIGTLDDLDPFLGAVDIVVISLPLTRATTSLIGARELALMKPEAMLINVGRAAIVEEDALFEHLRDTPSFSAGIDAWWQEPWFAGKFALRRPFLDLPNVVGSPHNSAITAGSLQAAARRAAHNVARYLTGELPEHVVNRSDYVGHER